MIFANRIKNPAALIPISMMFLVSGLLLPEFFHPATQMGLNLNHAVRGLLMGISLGVGLMSVRLAARQRRRDGN